MDVIRQGRPPAAVAVVASAGGVEALIRFVQSLPANFPAAVLVVLHMPDTGPSVLPGILTRAGALPAVHAEDGMALAAGVIVVAPPGRHLRVTRQTVELDGGPRENGHRPSADALLLSAARAFGDRAAGVVLSGTMDDGAAGLRSVGLAGGLTVVQDPVDASFPGMPQAAIAEATPDLVCRVDAMGAHLTSWASRFAAGEEPSAEARGTDPALPAVDEGMPEMQEIAPFTCPECGGNLWLGRGDGVERYHCRVGHAFSPRGLLVGKQDAVEAALWAAVVALEERGDLVRRLLRRRADTASPPQLQRYRDEIEQGGKQIEILRSLIGDLMGSSAQTTGSDEEDDGADPSR